MATTSWLLKLALPAALAGTTAGFADKAFNGSTTGVINACISPSGQLRMANDGQCKSNETPISWNVQGPTGAQGSQGPAGTTGAQVSECAHDSRDGSSTCVDVGEDRIFSGQLAVAVKGQVNGVDCNTVEDRCWLTVSVDGAAREYFALGPFVP